MCDVPGASSPRAIRCYQCHLKKCRHHHPDHERSSVEKMCHFMAHATSNKDMYEILSSSQDKRLAVKEEYTFIPPAPTATSFRRWSMSAGESPTTDPQSWLWQSRQVSASQSSEQRRPRSRFLSVDSSVSSERQVALKQWLSSLKRNVNKKDAEHIRAQEVLRRSLQRIAGDDVPR